MKKTRIYIIILAILLASIGCNTDNYPSGNDELFAEIANDNNKFLYYDINPDSILPDLNQGNPHGVFTMDFDVDGDGSIDLTFKYISEFDELFKRYFDIETVDSSFYISIEDSTEYPRVFNYGDPIDCNMNFRSGKFIFLDIEVVINHNTGESSSSAFGNWFHINRKSFAFRFFKNNEWNMGWMNIGFTYDNSKLVIYEYGYERDFNCSDS